MAITDYVSRQGAGLSYVGVALGTKVLDSNLDGYSNGG